MTRQHMEAAPTNHACKSFYHSLETTSGCSPVILAGYNSYDWRCRYSYGHLYACVWDKQEYPAISQCMGLSRNNLSAAKISLAGPILVAKTGPLSNFGPL